MTLLALAFTLAAAVPPQASRPAVTPITPVTPIAPATPASPAAQPTPLPAALAQTAPSARGDADEAVADATRALVEAELRLEEARRRLRETERRAAVAEREARVPGAAPRAGEELRGLFKELAVEESARASSMRAVEALRAAEAGRGFRSDVEALAARASSQRAFEALRAAEGMRRYEVRTETGPDGVTRRTLEIDGKVVDLPYDGVYTFEDGVLQRLVFPEGGKWEAKGDGTRFEGIHVYRPGDQGHAERVQVLRATEGVPWTEIIRGQATGQEGDAPYVVRFHGTAPEVGRVTVNGVPHVVFDGTRIAPAAPSRVAAPPAPPAAGGPGAQPAPVAPSAAAAPQPPAWQEPASDARMEALLSELMRELGSLRRDIEDLRRRVER